MDTERGDCAAEETGGKRRVLVAEDSEDVQCGTCGARLSARGVLLPYAKGERRFRHAEMEARPQLEVLERSVAALRAEERRIKARIRRGNETWPSTLTSSRGCHPRSSGPRSRVAVGPHGGSPGLGLPQGSTPRWFSGCPCPGPREPIDGRVHGRLIDTKPALRDRLWQKRPGQR